MKEKRTLTIDLETARKWYKSGNEALRKLALQVFPDRDLNHPEIKEIINEILGDVVLYDLTEVQLIQLKALHNRGNENISSNKILRILAIYFNKGWKKTSCNIGYFLNKNVNDEWTTAEHKSVCYPGIAYFKEKKYAHMAIKILGKTKLENLFTDL